MYVGDFVVLVPYISNEFIFIIKMNISWFLYKKCVLCIHAVGCKCMY